MSETKAKNPPKTATLTDQLRWYVRHSEDAPVDVARAAGIHHSTLYRFLDRRRGMSLDSLDALAKALGVRLVRDRKKRARR